MQIKAKLAGVAQYPWKFRPSVHIGPGRVTAGVSEIVDISPLDNFDRNMRGQLATFVGGQSPWAAMAAWQDWIYHLGVSPGRQVALWQQAAASFMKLATNAFHDPQNWAFKPPPTDNRFRSPAWGRPPFSLLAQAHLALEEQWRFATTDVRGLSEYHRRRVEFIGRLLLNAIAPINGVITNPEVLDAAAATGGRNFLDGAQLFWSDLARLLRGGRLTGLDEFVVGKTMAMTPGHVVFRNDLMEVIQYTPTTEKVHAEPILIVPAWIMKYYILDLTPETSLVRYLVGQGFTVFIISWRNPGAEARKISFDEYRQRGVETALNVVARIVPDHKIQAVGYCIGGSTLAISAAVRDRDGRNGLASLSLLAAQTDFAEAGDLLLFIDESQLSLLEDMMMVQGYLDARQMSGAFYALRTNEMLWSQIVERYLIGKPKPLGPLDAWLADCTRMPAQMHSEYLRKLFLDNQFALGRYEAGGQAVAVKNTTTPVFALGAERDYIAPWRSVYQIELYGSADTTFVLTGGGHNAGVVSPPGKPGAYFRMRSTKHGATYLEPDEWFANVSRQDGSWWPCWAEWLKQHSSAEMVTPPPPGGAF